MLKFYRFEGESDDELIYRICKSKEEIGTWNDVADILNKLLNTDYNESAFRKKFQSFNKMFEANRSVFGESKAEIEDIMEQKRELEKERKKLQTEKIEYNRWLREEARDELIAEKICEAITTLTSLEVPDIIDVDHSKKEYIFFWGDEHFGAEFELTDIYGRIINSYSPEIFEQRMWELLRYVIEIIEDKNISTLHCVSLGDFCDGVLRVSQLMKLRYGVVESTIKYAEFICNWLNELSKYVKIKYYMTNGNHSELRMIGQPKDTFTEDNMGKVVAEYIKVRLCNNPNFSMIENPSGHIFLRAASHTFLAIHGEVKNMKRALHEYSAIYNVPIQYLCAGHLHHYKKESVGIDSEVINIPSIIGVDPYGMSLRKTSAPGALLVEVDPLRGITCEHHLRLIS